MNVFSAYAKLQGMSDAKRLVATRVILRQMIQASGCADATQLARKAGLAHTTLTRILNEDVSWAISGKTWMKLSKASGVPVTLLGDDIFVPDLKPGARDHEYDARLIRLLDFWSRLPPEGQDQFLNVVDAWAASLISAAKIG